MMKLVIMDINDNKILELFAEGVCDGVYWSSSTPVHLMIGSVSLTKDGPLVGDEAIEENRASRGRRAYDNN